MTPKSYAKMIAALFPLPSHGRGSVNKVNGGEGPNKSSRTRTNPNKVAVRHLPFPSDSRPSSLVPRPLTVEDPNFVPTFIAYRKNVEATAERMRQAKAEARLRFCAVAACAAVAIPLIIAASIAKDSGPKVGRDRPLNSFQAPGPFSPGKPAPYEVGGRPVSSANREGGSSQWSMVNGQLERHSKAIAQLQANEATNGKTLENVWIDHTNRLAKLENWLHGADTRAILPSTNQGAKSWKR